MASRGRRGMRWGRVAAVALAVAAAGYFLWPAGDPAPPNQNTTTDATTTSPPTAASAAAARKKVIDLTIPTPPPTDTPPKHTTTTTQTKTTPHNTQDPAPPTNHTPTHRTTNTTPNPQPDNTRRSTTPTPQPKPIMTAGPDPAPKVDTPTPPPPPAPPILAVQVPSKPTRLVPEPTPAPADAVAPPLPRYTGEPGSALAKGLAMIDDGKLIEGRDSLSNLLVRGGDDLSPRGAQTIRETLTRVNGALIFSPRVYAGDPLATEYVVQGGDLLLRIARKFGVSYQFLEQINGISARRIRPGQRLKVIRGPFHAVVTKSEYRMDMFLVGPDEKMVYVRSFPVGLGEEGSTPVGSWIARRDGKLENPSWTDPRNNKYFAPDDPMNPIGEYWIGIKGTDETTKTLSGYGIHGTVEPESIGRSASRGCVRMYADDIAMTYRMLVGGKSTVLIQP